jgi:Glycosyl transferases group 1
VDDGAAGPGGHAPPGPARRIAYLGNFQPRTVRGEPFSTESHRAASLEGLGHEVVRLQEGEVRASDVPDAADGCDLLVWTQTQGLADTGGTRDERARMLSALRARGVPTLAPHLDRWWGLDREWRIREEPYFRADLVATADGGHGERWRVLGINHVWSPPAVYEGECTPGVYRPELASDVAFVGGWKGYGHREWRPIRRAMVRALQRRYGSRFALWPKEGQPAVRGQALNDLYASVRVVVGDSCLAGGIENYVSDRVPETWGRGGFLLHCRTGYVERAYPDAPTWPLGDHEALCALVDYYLERPDAREDCRQRVHRHVLGHHTYRHRMTALLDEMQTQGFIGAEQGVGA